ncbi:MAG TPA: protein kinase [Micromonosporaceae bacterium]|nr:protein kinase [Micromonosporaceae bacterium]
MTGTQTLVAGRYRLVQPLGRGGMGTVWLARDEILHRDVAVKEVVPPPGLTQQEQDDLRRRTLREARAAARLNHPSVVRMYDVVDSPGTAPWIVMEYVQGRSLQQVIAEDGPVPPARAARIGLDVLSALQASHAVGVEHRDVKPSNVLMAQDGRVVLTDFGLATAPGEATVTRPGLVLGSPAYISPERARGEYGGPESDLWSLGATLYAAVEGKSPFDRSSPMATLTALATEDPPPAKRAGRLRRVLDGLLRKDPAQRLSAAEVERLLRKVAGSDRPSALTQAFRRTAAPAAPPSSAAVVALRPPAVVPTPPLDAGVAEAGPPGAAPPASSAAAPWVPSGAGSATETVPRREPAEVPPLPEHPSIGRAPVPVRPVPEEEPYAAEQSGHRTRLVIAVLALLALGLAALALLGPDGQLPGTRTAGPDVTQPATSPTSQPTAVPTASPAAGPTTSAPPAGQPPAGAPATRPPAQVPAPNPGSGGFTPPAGWRIYRDSTGFSVAVPSSWTVSRRGTIVYFDQPDGSRLLGIDITDEPKPNPVADWEAQEDYRVARGDFPDYERIKIVSCSFFRACADWEFRYTRNGVRMHVNNRGFVVSDTRAHGIWWSTTDADWAASLAYLDVVFRSFRPAP